jgi:hypothetical protein
MEVLGTTQDGEGLEQMSTTMPLGVRMAAE